LQNHGLLIDQGGKKPSIVRFVEAANRSPGFVGHKYIFGMPVGTATEAEFGLEYIQHRGFSSVGVACFLNGEAARNLMANKSDPLFCGKADSSHTTIAMLVRVGETEDLVEIYRLIDSARKKCKSVTHPLRVLSGKAGYPRGDGFVPDHSTCLLTANQR
jgi:hypothetical protein